MPRNIEQPAEHNQTEDVLHRLRVLRMIALLVGAFTLTFAVINYMRGMPWVTTIQAVTALISFAVHFSTRNASELPHWHVAYMLLFFTLLMVMIASPGVTESAFIWALIIPIMSYLLMGKRRGLLISAFFLLVANVIYPLKSQWLTGDINWIANSNLILSSLAVLAFSHAYEIGRESAYRRLSRLASTDPLTELGNRNSAREAFAYQSKRFHRDSTPASFVLFDLDFFKSINDSHGHDAGDAVLQGVAELLSSRLRDTDFAFRIGGEEFGVLLAETHAADAGTVAEDLRKKLESQTVRFRGKGLRITMTAGIAELGPDGKTFDALYKVADQRLYRGKESGRNCVVDH